MVLDLDSFRDDKGGDANKVRVNQEKRFKDLKLVEKVISEGICRLSQFSSVPSSSFRLQTLNGDLVATKLIFTTS